MAYGNLIKRKIEIKEFLDIVKTYKPDQIECTAHTFFRLSEEQRKIFKCENLKEFILNDEPILVGLQFNGNYATFYSYEKKIMRMMLNIQYEKINIVTFYFVNQLPRI